MEKVAFGQRLPGACRHLESVAVKEEHTHTAPEARPGLDAGSVAMRPEWLK